MPQQEKKQEMLMAQLLFHKQPKPAFAQEIKAMLEKQLGSVEKVSDKEKENILMFSVKKYKTQFKDAPSPISPVACFINPAPFDTQHIPEMQRSQFWDVQDGETVIESCTWVVNVFSFLSVGLDYREQAQLFLAQVETALAQYPTCMAIYIPISGKLMLPEMFISDKKTNQATRFLKLFLNVRFFNVADSKAQIIDSCGLHVFHMPDVQVHFTGLDPDDVVRYVYNLVSYQFENNFPIQNGDRVDGFGPDGKITTKVQWGAQYENALVEPDRIVLDVTCAEHAAGTRE